MGGNGKRRVITAYSAALSAVVIAIVVVLNMLVEFAEKHFALTLDITAGKVYELTDATKSLLASFEDEEFAITVLADETAFSQGIRTGLVNEILLRYRAESNGRIKLSYADIYVNPGIIEQYENETLEENCLIIEGSKGHRSVNISELFISDKNMVSLKDEIAESRVEQVITNSLYRLHEGRGIKIYMLTGHGETYYDSTLTAMNDEAYETENLSMTLRDVPDDASLIVISSPRTDFSRQDLSRLDDYLAAFGNVVLLYGSASPVLPNLDEYLEKWGVRYDRSIIIDPKRYIGNGAQVAPLPMDFEMNRPILGFADRYILLPGARPIDVLWENRGNRQTNRFLITSEESYSKSYDNKSGLISTVEKEPKDRNGAFNVGVISRLYDVAEGRVRVGAMLFLPSPEMLDDSLTSSPNLLNGYYFKNILSYMTGSYDAIYIPSKSMRGSVLNAVGVSNIQMFFIVVLAPSSLILTAGILRLLYRRKL
jgi:hypothetical protein